MGLSQSEGYLSGGPYSKDYRFFWVYIGVPKYGNYSLHLALPGLHGLQPEVGQDCQVLVFDPKHLSSSLKRDRRTQ